MAWLAQSKEEGRSKQQPSFTRQPPPFRAKFLQLGHTLFMPLKMSFVFLFPVVAPDVTGGEEWGINGLTITWDGNDDLGFFWGGSLL